MAQFRLDLSLLQFLLEHAADVEPQTIDEENAGITLCRRGRDQGAQAVGIRCRQLQCRFGRVDRDEAARAFAYAIYSHPGLRRARKEKLDSWSVRDTAFGGTLDTGSFHKSVDRHVEHLDSKNPSVESDRRYVFW